jgi:hypothetical protein
MVKVYAQINKLIIKISSQYVKFRLYPVSAKTVEHNRL